MLEAVLCTVVNIQFCWLQVMAAIHGWWCVQSNVMLILSGIPVTLLPGPAREGAPEAPPRHFVGNVITFIPAFESTKHRGLLDSHRTRTPLRGLAFRWGGHKRGMGCVCTASPSLCWMQ